ncbi:MAG: hypothetical protein HN341_06575 [Verrucomicrobia bacterium]|jgi:hypothetical protein|nr:hypothetical protein [Verrucomicrobiota bacterium]
MRKQDGVSDLRFRILVCSSAVLWIMHLVAEVLHLTLGSCPPLYVETAFGFGATRFNVPFWFSVLLLVYNAGLAFTIGIRSRGKTPLPVGWWILGGASLSIVAVMVVGARPVAEMLLRAVQAVPVPSAGAGIIALGVGILFVRFVLQQELQVRRRLLVAGGIYILGAVALELVSEALCGRRHEAGIAVVYAVVSTLEETCEMVGLLLSIRALRLHVFATATSS